MIETVTLTEFLATTGKLSLTDRQLIVEQALALLEQMYVHLPLKQSMYAVRPTQQLKLMHYKLLRMSDDSLPSEFQFHNEITRIFSSLRDLHTVYSLPEPFSKAAAFLPFLVEEYFENEQPKYLVSKLTNLFSHPTFVPGVEILYWNGTPVSRVVEINAERTSGSNLEARRVRGVMALTNRSMATLLPPDEEWVVMNYRALNGEELEIKQPWLVMRLETPTAAGSNEGSSAGFIEEIAVGVDVQADAIQQLKKILYAPHVVETEKDLSRTSDSTNPVASNHISMEETAVGVDAQADTIQQLKTELTASEELVDANNQITGSQSFAINEIPSRMASAFRAQIVEDTTNPGRKFGYIRIFTFSVGLNTGDADIFVLEFQRLIKLLPENGLILDVRGNGGGLIYAAERILQMLTPHRIEPERLEFINTPLTLELCKLNAPSSFNTELDLSPWITSIAQSTETGAMYSNGFPITSVELCNSIGQQYYGPVILITDAMCYSATDIFAAGFQDHKIGPILGVNNNTGAGGANVWKQTLLQRLLGDSKSNPFMPLPQGARMQVSIRRTIRVGERVGTPVEDLGVTPDYRHYMTKNDLLNNNVDLINRAISLISAQPIRKLSIEVDSISNGILTGTVITQNISRLDIFIDQRPVQSIDISDVTTQVIIRLPNGASSLELQGFDNNQLVAACQTKMQSIEKLEV